MTEITLKNIEKLFDEKFDQKFDEKFEPIKTVLAEHTAILNSHTVSLGLLLTGKAK